MNENMILTDSERKIWDNISNEIKWFKPWTQLHENQGNFHKWYLEGKTNVCYNCIDRHLAYKGDKIALIAETWDGQTRKYTFKEMHKEVCKFANVLKSKGVKKGDRVVFYLQMIPELVFGMLACARIGAIHSVVFGGFSAESLKDRINDSEAKLLVTMDESFIKSKPVPVKEKVDEVITDCRTLEKVIVVKRNKATCSMNADRDSWLHEEMGKVSDICDCEEMDSEDVLFILYTSGTTGKPKGIVHTTGGYLSYATLTSKTIFDLKEDDVYWCMADCGWITGHSYVVYGPLSNGITTVILEGNPMIPNPGRCWEIVDKHKVTKFYTAPTFIRSLMREGDSWIDDKDLSSLKILGTVGEPINPDVWQWYHDKIGKKKCKVVDTWWQTETGGIMIAPIPGETKTKPGSATLPFKGIEPAILREDGTEASANEKGYLVIKKPWPGMLRGIWKDPKRYEETYFSKFPGIYFTGDGALRDEDGYFWIIGRLDDVINVSGHRLGTAEVESALVSHPDVTEAAVVSYPHEIKGEGIYAFVTLRKDIEEKPELKTELVETVSRIIGPISKPEKIQFTPDLPKTRSGKIMRRILKAIAKGSEDIGNTTTLANPEVVDSLQDNRIE